MQWILQVSSIAVTTVLAVWDKAQQTFHATELPRQQQDTAYTIVEVRPAGETLSPPQNAWGLGYPWTLVHREHS